MLRPTKSLLLLLIAALTFNVAFAQKADKKAAKKEKKAVKKKLKSYMKDTESFTNMVDGYKEEIEEKETKAEELKSFNNTLKDDNTELNKQILALTNQLNDKQIALEDALKAAKSANFSDVGTEYRVQIGAYRNFDLTPFLTDNQFIGYKKVDGVYQYYIGAWANADDAFAFAQEFNKLDIDDSFVTKYVDGVRVDYDYLNK